MARSTLRRAERLASEAVEADRQGLPSAGVFYRAAAMDYRSVDQPFLARCCERLAEMADAAHHATPADTWPAWTDADRWEPSDPPYEPSDADRRWYAEHCADDEAEVEVEAPAEARTVEPQELAELRIS